MRFDYTFREIDHLDGCVYSCPRFPGVWSDWCKIGCKLYLCMTDEWVACRDLNEYDIIKFLFGED